MEFSFSFMCVKGKVKFVPAISEVPLHEGVYMGEWRYNSTNYFDLYTGLSY
jgi:hypothetical protein